MADTSNVRQDHEPFRIETKALFVDRDGLRPGAIQLICSYCNRGLKTAVSVSTQTEYSMFADFPLTHPTTVESPIDPKIKAEINDVAEGFMNIAARDNHSQLDDPQEEKCMLSFKISDSANSDSLEEYNDDNGAAWSPLSFTVANDKKESSSPYDDLSTQASETQSLKLSDASLLATCSEAKYYVEEGNLSISSSKSNKNNDFDSQQRVTTKRVIKLDESHYQCGNCSKIFQSYNLAYCHNKTHTDEQLKCKMCGEVFIVQFQLRRHMKTHRKYICKECKQGFSNLDALKKHITALQCGPAIKSEQVKNCDRPECVADENVENETTDIKTKHDSNSDLKCSLCNEHFLDAFKMREHMAEHKMHYCNHEGCHDWFSTLSLLEIHKKIHNESQEAVQEFENKMEERDRRNNKNINFIKGSIPLIDANIKQPVALSNGRFKCAYCNLNFSTYYIAVTHCRKHLDVDKYECLLCGKQFFEFRRIAQHVDYHSSDRPHICREEGCGTGFETLDKLHIHTLKVHTPSTGPFHCTFGTCDIVFKNNSDFKCHLRKHTFPVARCEICNKDFITLQRVKEHSESQLHLKAVKECSSPDASKIHEALLQLAKQITPKKFKGKEMTNVRVIKGTYSASQLTSSMPVSLSDGSFQCPQCNLSFSKLRYARMHIKTHLDVDKYQCLLCNKVFLEKGRINQHMTCHKVEKPYICQEAGCGIGFTTSEKLELHKLRYHHDLSNGTLLCTFQNCNTIFKNKKLLRLHLAKHQRELNQRLCLFCNTVFDTIEDCRSHHCKQKKQTTWDTTSDTVTEKGSGKNQETRMDSVSVDIANDHLVTSEKPTVISKQMHGGSHRESAGNCGPKKQESKKVKVNSSTENSGVLCPKCGKMVRNRKSLHGHMEVHKETYSFHCSHCPKKFVSRNRLNKHITCHNKEKPYTCEHCGKHFKTGSAIRKHIRLFHGEDKDKNYTCEHCGKEFHDINNLKCHIKGVHDKKLSFYCDICSKGFRNREACRVHKRTHTGEKPYTCPQCNKKVANKRHIERCMKKQTEAVPPCKDCGKILNSLNYLRLHRLKFHGKTDDRQSFKCPVCNASFLSQTGMEVHFSMKHPYETPFFYNKLENDTLVLKDTQKEENRNIFVNAEVGSEIDWEVIQSPNSDL